MAAKVSPRVQRLVDEAAALAPNDLAALIEAIQTLPRRDESLPGRIATIQERVARATSADVETLSVEDVERSIRKDLDF